MSKNDFELLGICLADTLVAMKQYLLNSFEKHKAEISFEEWMNLRPLVGRPQTQKDLAFSLGKDKTTVSRLLDDWERRKLVRRVPHEIDGRIKLVEVTPRARDLHQKLTKMVRDADSVFCSSLNRSERELLIACAKKVRQSLSCIE